MEQVGAATRDDYLFPSGMHASPHVGTRQYARIVDGWIDEIFLHPVRYATHSIRAPSQR